MLVLDKQSNVYIYNFVKYLLVPTRTSKVLVIFCLIKELLFHIRQLPLQPILVNIMDYCWCNANSDSLIQGVEVDSSSDISGRSFKN